MSERKNYDVIVIGAGPGGLTAALYAARANLKVVILDRGIYGGQMNNTAGIDNYPGFVDIQGPELGEKMYQTAMNAGAEFAYGDVQKIEQDGNQKIIKTDSGEYEAAAVVIATGAVHKHLGVAGEEEYAGKGFFIFLCGSKEHPENIGTISYCGKNVYVIEKEDDVEEALEILKNSNINKLLIISQTTYSLEKFIEIEKRVKSKLPKNIELILKNTICKATELRQNETEKISKMVDYMIIIGGVNSSNTKKLYEIAKVNCKKCICVETAVQLDIAEIEKSNKVGIMAGASTPEESIQKILEKVEKIIEI